MEQQQLRKARAEGRAANKKPNSMSSAIQEVDEDDDKFTSPKRISVASSNRSSV
jgi:hypothetical protein